MDIEKTVDSLVSEETFDVFDWVSRATLPENDVTIYTDYDAGLRLKRLVAIEKENAEKSISEGFSLADEVEYVDEDEVNELVKRIDNSSMIFHLRGLSPERREEIEAQLREEYKDLTPNEEEFWTKLNSRVIAESIISITNLTGAVDKKQWTPDLVLAFSKKIHPDEFAKLVGGSLELTFTTELFDARVSADFS